MDETEKYKQRLEAIAEKRRLQEEQDKARRELEDEKLRLQQLKRKSLRDQWLMEGAPLSPTSLDTQSSRSPPWGSQTHDVEKTNDELPSEHQPLAEEEDDEVEDLTESDATGLLNVAEEGSENSALQNGDNPNRPETVADTVKVNGGDIEAIMNHNISEQNGPPTSNGPVGAIAGVAGVKPDLTLSVGEAEPAQLYYQKEEEEEDEEEGTLVMRAECVIITDEGDDASQEDNQESVQLEDVHLLNPEVGDAVEDVQEVENTETLTESEKSSAFEVTAEAQPVTENTNNDDGTRASENRDAETEVEGQAGELEDPATVHLQSPADALEGATVAFVPVYSEAQTSILSPRLEHEVEASVAPEGAEAALLATEEPACPPGHFQDVSLADPQDNHRTKAVPGEREPLLLEVKAPANSTAEPARVDRVASTERQSPSRAEGQREQAQGPKSCSCCSVM